MKHILILILSCLLLVSCTPEVQDNCSLADCSGFGTTYNEEKSQISYYDPCFNPNDHNEICYIRKEWNDNIATYAICKYNFSTQQSNILYSWDQGEASIVYPEWGRMGYITFGNILNKHIYILSENGGIPVQITNTDFNYYPKWNYSGDKILYKQYNGSEYIGILMDLAGNKLDSIPNDSTNASLTHSFCLPDGSFMCLYSDSYFYQYNSSLNYTGKFEPDYNIDFFMIWDADPVANTSKTIWSNSRGGICSTDLSTHQTTEIRNNCAMRYSGPLSVSPCGSKVIFTVTYYERVNDCLYNYSYKLHMMNIDGSEEIELELP